MTSEPKQVKTFSALAAVHYLTSIKQQLTIGTPLSLLFQLAQIKI
jgi:hypothetical protein